MQHFAYNGAMKILVIEDDREAEVGPDLEHGAAAPAVAAVDDVVVRAVELAAQRPLERLDLGADVVVVGRHPQDPHGALTLDVGLVGVPDDQQIDRVLRRQRADHVAELDAGAAGAGHGAEAGDEHARHG